MKSLLKLLQTILADAKIWCDVSTTRDLETITRRTKHEGLSFLMITLPDFCSDFEKSLSEGQIVPSAFRSFSKNRALPRFLGGLLERVFDRLTGTLLDSPDISAIYFIRQICLSIKKMNTTCSPERVNRAFQNYVKTNESCLEWEIEHANEFKTLWDGFDQPLFSRSNQGTELHRFKSVASILWGKIIQEDLFLSDSLIPRHGPGATAERVLGNKKYSIMKWHERLEPYFPFTSFGIPSLNFDELLKDVEFLSPGAETPVRVITVPKTLKTLSLIHI